MLGWLCKVGSLSRSLAIYLPAVGAQKVLGLVRVLLFAYLMRHVQHQYGLWIAGVMLFAVGGPLATLGANHGLTRYVSLYESSGQLASFYRRIRWGVIGCVLAVVILGFIFAGQLGRYFVASEIPSSITGHDVNMRVTWLALLNVLAGALYYDLLAVLAGMRTYRIISLLEVGFSVLLTIVGTAVLMARPTAVALLTAHMVCLSATFCAGAVVLHLAIERSGVGRAVSADHRAIEPLVKVLRFGFVAMIGNLVWIADQYMSFHLTNRRFGKNSAAVFGVFLQLAQPAFLLASSAWSVIFTYAAKQWETSDRRLAVDLLETAYKSVVLVTTAVAIAILAAVPVWNVIVPVQYRQGFQLLGELVMFFGVLSNLAMLTMLAKLQERPWIIVVAAFAGGVANLLVAWWLMPLFEFGPKGAALAAGVGMYIGAGLVSAVYFPLCGIRLGWWTYLLMASPVILLLPPAIAGGVWSAVLVAAMATRWVFSRSQRELMEGAVRAALSGLGKRLKR